MMIEDEDDLEIACILAGLMDGGENHHLDEVVEWAATAEPAHVMWLMSKLVRVEGQIQKARSAIQQSRLYGPGCDDTLARYIEQGGDLSGKSPFSKWGLTEPQ